MTVFLDIFELLESVRQHELRPRECLIPLNSVDGTTIGYATADSNGPSLIWTIGTRTAKASALARGTKEARRIRELLCSHMGRRQILDELRSGTLEYGVAKVAAAIGPKQLMIPGL